jgi:two-component system sensor histidine kinase DegS
VQLSSKPTEILLQVRDNGRGFDRAKGGKAKHLGLVSMTERAAIVGGEIDVASERGKGTIVSVRIPLRGKPK